MLNPNLILLFKSRDETFEIIVIVVNGDAVVGIVCVFSFVVDEGALDPALATLKSYEKKLLTMRFEPLISDTGSNHYDICTTSDIRIVRYFV